MHWLDSFPIRSEWYEPLRCENYRGNGNPRNNLYIALPCGKRGVPGVLFFHGGGLTGDNPECPEKFYNGELAVVQARYRICPGTSPIEIVDDAAAAVGYAVKHLADWGVAPEQFFVGGMSAGCYLAALAAMNPAYGVKYGYDARKFCGLLLASGQMTAHFKLRAELGLGRPGVPLIDEWAPLFHVSPEVPPLLCVTGESGRDIAGRPEENAFFVATLRALGHPDATCRQLPGLDHVGSFASSDRLFLNFIARRVAAVKGELKK